MNRIAAVALLVAIACTRDAVAASEAASGGLSSKSQQSTILVKRLLEGEGGQRPVSTSLASAEEEVLILEDNFNTLDTNLWKHEITLAGGGNGEFQAYTNNNTNSFVEDGVLFIQPTLTADVIGEKRVTGEEPYEYDVSDETPGAACTNEMFFGCRRSSNLETRQAINPIQSAQLTTAKTFSFTYGRVEMRAKLPKGKWLFPAFWMMPVSAEYGLWPKSGEIDIFEARGNPPNYSPETPERGGYDTFSSCMHWGPSFELNEYNRTFDYIRLHEPHNFADEWHTFGLRWTEDGVYTYLDNDDNRVLEVKFDEPFWQRGELDTEEGVKDPWKGHSNAAPFDKAFYLIMNVAVGGMTIYFPETHDKPWTRFDGDAALNFWENREDWLPTWQPRESALKVDWVRVWQQHKDIDLHAEAATPSLAALDTQPYALAANYEDPPQSKATADAPRQQPHDGSTGSGGGGAKNRLGSSGVNTNGAQTGSKYASKSKANSKRGGEEHSGAAVCSHWLSCTIFGLAIGALLVGAVILTLGAARSYGWLAPLRYEEIPDAAGSVRTLQRRGSGSHKSFGSTAMLRCQSGEITCEFGSDETEGLRF